MSQILGSYFKPLLSLFFFNQLWMLIFDCHSLRYCLNIMVFHFLWPFLKVTYYGYSGFVHSFNCHQTLLRFPIESIISNWDAKRKWMKKIYMFIEFLKNSTSSAWITNGHNLFLSFCSPCYFWSIFVECQSFKAITIKQKR